MRCTSCGLPLSPARTITSCPRCGTPIITDRKPFPQAEPWRPLAPQAQLSEIVPGPMTHAGSDSFNSPGAHVQFPAAFSLTGQERRHAEDGVPQISLPQGARPTIHLTPAPTGYDLQPDQMRFPTTVSQGNKGSNPQQPQLQEHGQASPPGLRAGAKNQEFPYASPPHQAWPLKHPQHPEGSKNNLGFIVAGLCVIVGGLILIFVYFMAIGLPGSSMSNNAVKTNTARTTSSSTTASSPVSSATATSFPGQKYIDNAQMATSIDPTSHQPTQLTTTFKTNQRMYITFQLHPGGQSGAACLLWYMNNKEFFSYPLSVYPNEGATYSYASYGGTGSGYVEIYWASTTKCSDKILAQHVDFTIST